MKQTRPISVIILHCSATPEKRDYTVEDLKRDHIARGFSGIGYHFYIRKNGDVITCRPIEEVGAHCEGHNTGSIGICYEGGLDNKLKAKDTRTPEIKNSTKNLISVLRGKYGKLKVRGHRDFSKDLNGDGKITKNEYMKECPCFDAMVEFPDLK